MLVLFYQEPINRVPVLSNDNRVSGTSLKFDGILNQA